MDMNYLNKFHHPSLFEWAAKIMVLILMLKLSMIANKEEPFTLTMLVSSMVETAPLQEVA